jgi:hypothetical protein
MLKATAQKRFRGTVLAWGTAAMFAAGALCLAFRSPFMTFSAVFLAAGGIVTGLGDLISRAGAPRAGAIFVIVLGALFTVSGVLLFAPQPLWVGSLLLPLGIVTASRR